MTSSFSLFADLKARLQTGDAAIAVVGLGYVGLPLSMSVCEAGFGVTGFELDETRVARINAGEQVLSYFPEDRISNAVGTGRYQATSDTARIADQDVVLVCVPTPLSDDGTPDTSIILAAVEGFAPHLKPGALVVIESTVWPGVTREKVQPLLEATKKKVGQDVFLAFSPEREDPGNATFHTNNIPKVVGADDPHSLDLVKTFYEAIIEKVVPVNSSATAEAVKLFENSFRTVNIALVNEAKYLCNELGIDVFELIDAAATKPFGFMPFYPGPGIGGACIPVSPVFLSWRAREVGVPLPMVEHAIRSNAEMPGRVAQRVAEAAGGNLDGKKVLVLGISYKKDIEDARLSPAFDIVARMEAAGAHCDYHDPYFAEHALNDANSGYKRPSVAITAEAVAGYDAVLVVTDHSDVDYALIATHARAIVDTRNIFTKLGIGPCDKISAG